MSVRNILDGTIPVGGSGGLTPESDIQVNHVYSNLGFHTPGIFGGKEVRLTHELTVPKINIGTYATTDDSEITSEITEEGITTPALTLGGDEVLVSKRAEGTLAMVAVFVGDTSGTYQVNVNSFFCDITPKFHMLSSLVTLSECKTMKSLTFNTGLRLDGKTYKAFGTTVCKIGDAYLDAYVDLYMENDFLIAKLTFKDTPEYTSMIIKVNMFFH